MAEDAEIKSCVFTRDLKGWNVCFQCVIPVHDLIHDGSAVGVTAGAAEFATLSTGEVIPRPHIARRVERELRRRQRALARCKDGSVRRGKVRKKLMKMHETIRNGRRTFLHQHSAQLARQYRLIAIEEIPALSRTAKGAAWGDFITMLTYKAESAGGEAIKVKLRGARNTCSTCGALLPRNSSATVVRCDCGSVVDRDCNAALNILALVVTGQGQANVAADGQGTSS